jgi:hypothetical protein
MTCFQPRLPTANPVWIRQARNGSGGSTPLPSCYTTRRWPGATVECWASSAYPRLWLGTWATACVGGERMRAVIYLAAHELGARWRSWAVLVLLVTVAGGGVLTAVAGRCGQTVPTRAS